MTNDTDHPAGHGDGSDGRQPADETLATSGHLERAVLHHMVSESGGARPTTVSAVLDDVAAVIERGDYGNIGPRNTAGAAVRKSSLRRTFTQLREKGLVRRVGDLEPTALQSDRYDLGPAAGDPTDPAAYARTSDDARVTDWLLTETGRREVARLDARYAAELDALAARYGRPRGETTARVDA